MNGFIRKMCILKELKKGFSADGSPLGGVTRVETFADRVTLQISLINFAPLSEGRYICVLCDKEGERLLFPLSPGINEYRTENKTFDAEKGFCCLIVFAFRDDAQCVAGGQYGGGSYSMKLLLSGLRAEPSVVQNDPPMSEGNSPLSQNEPPMPEKKENEKQIIFEEKKEKYDDERICERNYYTESGVADPIAQV